MNESGRYSFSNVISVNPYNKTYINAYSNILHKQTNPKFSKHQFTISYLNTKEFINAQIQISKSIPDEDLSDAINSQAYDELSLDHAVEYKIGYIEIFTKLHKKNRYFHLFILKPLQITQTFVNTLKKIKYLDVTIPAPLLLKSIYSKGIINSHKLHCFIYLQKDDAFVSIYGNKEFIYAKSFKYSFIDMHKRFCELSTIDIDYNSFIKFYTEISLKEIDSEYKSSFIQLYKELFASINDILTYARRTFEIENFEHLYIGSELETITKLDEMLEVELSIKSSKFDFNYSYNTSNTYIDQLHLLMQIYPTLHKDERYECDFSLNHRPPAFIKRESGKIIILTAASLSLAFIYPLTYWIFTYTQNLQKDFLEEKYNKIHHSKILRESIIINKQVDKKKSLALLKLEKDEYFKKKDTLIKIHNLKINYLMKAKLLVSLTQDLNKFNVKIESLSYGEKGKERTFHLNIIASQDRGITKLLHYLSTKYEEKFRFQLQDISYDEENNTYISQLNVNLL